MSLEPTPQQLEELDEHIGYRPKARDLFEMVRDWVLEAGMRECEGLAERALATPPDDPRRQFEECFANGASNCVSALHLLKGKATP